MREATCLLMILVAAATAPVYNTAKPSATCGLCLTAVEEEQTKNAVKERLEKSTRHHEWVEVMSGKRKIMNFLVYPEVKDKATAVLVIHDNKGLTDWACSVADQLAEAGYIAISVDLLSGMGPGGGNTKDFKSAGEATAAIGKVKDDVSAADLNAVSDYIIKLPACNGKLTVAGFCWGGGQCFRFATERPDLKAAFVFYGSPPKNKESLRKIACPVYGFYGENDARINATIPDTTKAMKDLGKTYDPVIYPGAGHGFMRNAEESASPKMDDQKARTSGWERWKALLQKI
jgi:carboxymethylenebutenolidase